MHRLVACESRAIRSFKKISALNLHKFSATTQQRKDNVKTDEFGSDTKYASLDSKSLKSSVEIKEIKKRKLIASRFISPPNDADSFGTLGASQRTSDESDDRLKSANSDDDVEKKYDKILEHRPLTNDSNQRNTENFYAAKIKRLSIENKVIQTKRNDILLKCKCNFLLLSFFLR